MWPLGLMTMSVVGGQNNAQPSYVAGWPLGQTTIISSHIQAERSCSTECRCSLPYPLWRHLTLTNYVSLMTQGQAYTTQEITGCLHK